MRTFFLIAFVVLAMAILTLLRLILCVLGSLVYLYLLPGTIADKRGHPRMRDIYLVCAFGGWLVLPWLGALWVATHGTQEDPLAAEAPLAMHGTDE